MDRRNEKIKFVHTSDWHLGFSNLSKKDDDGIPIQFRWIMQSADELVKHIHTEKVDIVFMCGDILNTRNPSPTVENILAKILYDITSQGAKVIYLIGNHEIPGWGDHPMKIYDTLRVPGVSIADKVDIHRIELKNDKTIQIATIPYPVDFELDEALRMLSDKVEPGIPAVAMLHSFVTGAKLSGSDINILPDEPHLEPMDFHQLPFDYIALGHIHRYQRIWNNPPAVYCGSFQKTSFAEETENKGFVAGTISQQNDKFVVNSEFVEVESANFITLNI
ncbi:hypothetical protein DRQ33_05045, partial [bacterium]